MIAAVIGITRLRNTNDEEQERESDDHADEDGQLGSEDVAEVGEYGGVASTYTTRWDRRRRAGSPGCGGAG